MKSICVCGIRAGDPAQRLSVWIAALDVVEAEVLDLQPADEVVLGDDLAVDHGRRAEVAVVPAPGGVADQDQDRDADGEEEAEVDQAVAAVAGIPPGAAAASRDGSGSERHGGKVSCSVSGAPIMPGALAGPNGTARSGETRRRAQRSAGSTIRSTKRSVAWPSATSNESARKRATRSRSKSPARSQRGELLGGLEDGPGDARPEVEVEAPLVEVVVVVGGEEGHRPAEQRELEDRAGVVGDEDVADEHQLVDVRMVGHVDRERREVRRDRLRLADERVQAQEQHVIRAELAMEDPEVEVLGATSPCAPWRPGTSVRTGSPSCPRAARSAPGSPP